MKKIFFIAMIISILNLCAGICLGFKEVNSIVLTDFNMSQDNLKLILNIANASSMGYTRGYKNKGGGIKSHYLVFYSTFGGPNSQLGAVDTVELNISPDDTEVYFKTSDHKYKLVLVKDRATNKWIIPTTNFDEIVVYGGVEYDKKSLSPSTLHWLELSEEEKRLVSYFPPEFIKRNMKILRNNFDNQEVALTDKEITYVNQILGGVWSSTVPDCLMDYTIEIHGNIYKYHSECGNILDVTANRVLTVDEDTRIQLNYFLDDKYIY